MRACKVVEGCHHNMQWWLKGEEAYFVQHSLLQLQRMLFNYNPTIATTIIEMTQIYQKNSETIVLFSNYSANNPKVVLTTTFFIVYGILSKHSGANSITSALGLHTQSHQSNHFDCIS